jgi:prevent-host-death family protein
MTSVFVIMTICGHDQVMRAVKIAELKSQLSRHLRHVRAGGVVTVLDRNTPVARLVPVDRDEDLVISRPAPDAPALRDVKLPRPTKLAIDVVDVLLEDRRRRR